MKVTRSLKKGMIIAVATGAFLWQGAYAQEAPAAVEEDEVDVQNPAAAPAVAPAAAPAAVEVDEDEEEVEVLDNLPAKLAEKDISAKSSGSSYVTIKSGMSVLQSVGAVAGMMSPQHSLRTDLLSDAERTLLSEKPNAYSTDVEKPWRTVLNEILRPTGISFCENNGDEIVLGSPEAVSAFIHSRAITALTDNHEMIAVDFKGGWPINEALDHIADKAGFDINYDYMEEKFRVINTREEEEQKKDVQAANAGKSEAEKTAVNADSARPSIVTTYVNKQPMEWRYVMHEVLDPIGYTFVEENGSVRPMSVARYAQYEQDKINARPLETKVINLHHVRPERVVEILAGGGKGQQQTPTIIRHKNGFIRVVTEEKDRTKMFSGSAVSVSTGEGTEIGDSGNTSFNFRDFERPRTAPAVLISDIAENIPVIEERIKMIDVPERQILVEALILNVDEETSRQLGIAWSGFDKIGGGASWAHNREYINGRGHLKETYRKGSYSETSSTKYDVYKQKYKSSMHDPYAVEKESDTTKTEGATTTDSSSSAKAVSSSTSLEGSATSGSQTTSTSSGRTQFTSSQQTIDGTDYRELNGGKWEGSGTYTATPKESETGFSASALTAPILDGITDFSFRTKSTSFRSWVGPIDLAATINLVRENGESQILASPVIVMGDHTESLIRIGTAIPVPITKYTDHDTSSSSYRDYETEWIQVMSGHTLWVSPEITADGESIRLSVHPQVTEADENDEKWPEARDGSRYPIVYTRELDTRVSVPSGQTLLLGGLIQSSNVDMHHKIWLLGDIPFLGRLFRWNTTTKVRRNLMILIRPTILNDGAPDTGFEVPSQRMMAPLEKGVGRDMRLPERDTTLEDNEKALLHFFRREKDGTLTEVKGPAEDSAAKAAD